MVQWWFNGLHGGLVLWNSVPYLEARIPFRSGLLCCHDNKNDHPTFITKQPGRRFCEAIFLLPGFFALTSMVFVSQELILKEKNTTWMKNQQFGPWYQISNLCLHDTYLHMYWYITEAIRHNTLPPQACLLPKMSVNLLNPPGWIPGRCHLAADVGSGNSKDFKSVGDST